MPAPFPKSRRAFTLAEVSVAAALTLVMVTLTLGVVLHIAGINARTDIKDQLDGDFRKVVNVLMENGRVANAFRIYRSFEKHAASANLSEGDTAGTGESGDLVVFAFHTTATDLLAANPNAVPAGKPVTTPAPRIRRILGVYRDSSYNNGFGAIRWFDSDRHAWGQSFSSSKPAPAGTPIETLLPDTAAKTKFPVLAEMTLGAIGSGTTASADSSIFYNINGNTFTVNGLIYKKRTTSGGIASGGFATGPGATTRYDAKNIFNITITPRS